MKNLLLFLAIFGIVTCTFLLSCSGNGNKISIDDNKMEIYQSNKEIEVLVKNWQLDNLGCQKLRTKQLAETIMNRLQLAGTAKAKFFLSR